MVRAKPPTQHCTPRVGPRSLRWRVESGWTCGQELSLAYSLSGHPHPYSDSCQSLWLPGMRQGISLGGSLYVP